MHFGREANPSMVCQTLWKATLVHFGSEPWVRSTSGEVRTFPKPMVLGVILAAELACQGVSFLIMLLGVCRKERSIEGFSEQT